LHFQVAQALKQLHADALEPIYAQLAFHYEIAGELALAIDAYQQAAIVVYSRFAAADAVALLSRARTLADALPASELRQRRLLSILLQLREPLLLHKGHTAPELGEIGHQASALAQELGLKRERILAMAGLRSYAHMCGHYQEALVTATQMLTLANEILSTVSVLSENDAELLDKPHHGLANVLLYTGQLIEARTHFDHALALPRVSTGRFVFSALNWWLLGYPDRARKQMHQALVFARNLGHPHEIGFAMTNLARLNHFLRRTQLAQLWAQQSIALCSTYEIPFWVKLSNLFLGRSMAETGEYKRGIALLQKTLGQLADDGHQAFCSYFWGLLVEAYVCSHQYTEAERALERAFSYVERNGETFWHPELLRLRGDVAVAQGRPIAAVESCYEQAIAIAQAQEGKSLELRATVSLCRLWQQQGKGAEAYIRLAALYGGFAEGQRTVDLQAAQQLLAVLSTNI